LNRQTRIETGFAVSVIVLGLYLLYGSGDINLGSGYDRIGPRFFPYLIAAGLLITSLMMLLESWQQRHDTQALSIEIFPLVYIASGLILCVLTLEPLGFVLAVTLLFVMISRAFKSTRPLRDAGVGLVLAVIVYYIFTSGLGLVLPEGILAGIM
jgi:putative tricarboxylic transport membrane protein